MTSCQRVLDGLIIVGDEVRFQLLSLSTSEQRQRPKQFRMRSPRRHVISFPRRHRCDICHRQHRRHRYHHAVIVIVILIDIVDYNITIICRGELSAYSAVSVEIRSLLLAAEMALRRVARAARQACQRSPRSLGRQHRVIYTEWRTDRRSAAVEYLMPSSSSNEPSLTAPLHCPRAAAAAADATSTRFDSDLPSTPPTRCVRAAFQTALRASVTWKLLR